MPPRLPADPDALRQHRNTRIYRSMARILRELNRRLVEHLHERGYTDFSPAFPQILANVDTDGTRIGVLAARAGITRQAAGQLVTEIERCGYVVRRADREDARATVIVQTPRGRKLLATVLEFLADVEAQFAATVGGAALERVRDDLFRIAEAFDPVAALRARDD